MPGLFYTAEFHSVWQPPQDDLVCVTPKPDGERTVLFLPDKRYGPAFDFFKRPSNLRMRVYGHNRRKLAVYAKIAELSEARRNYEVARAAKQGLTLMQSIGSRFAWRDNFEMFIDDFLKNVGVLENMLVPTQDGMACKDPRLESEFHRRSLEVGHQKAKLFLMVDLMVRGAVPLEKE